jgi:hypothetical protein
MSSDSMTFASDAIRFGRDGASETAPPSPTAPATPEKDAPSKDQQATETRPSKLKSAGGAFADLMMWIGVVVTGGIFAMIGYRRVSAVRLAVEAAIISAIIAALLYTTKTWIHPFTEGIDLNEPLHRGILLVVCAIALAYVGGIVVHLGWHRKGDPKVSMLFVAVGMTLIGLRIASLGMAYGEIRVTDARRDAGAAGLTAIKATVDVMKAEGIDPKPVGKIIMDFQKDLYGSKFIEGVYSAIGKPKKEISPSDLEAPAPAAKPEISAGTSAGGVSAVKEDDHPADGGSVQ